MDILRSAHPDGSDNGKQRVDLLESIKEVSQGIIEETTKISKWITQASHESLREYQRQKQESIRKESLLQTTLAQLKEEHIKLLEERQMLAQETETEQEEIKKIKVAQQEMEERQEQATLKKQALSTTLSQTTAQVIQLRRTLKQEEEREEKEGERMKKEIEYYANLFNLYISTVEDGSVLFLFKIEGNEYYFQISMTDTYSIIKASISEKCYKSALDELESTHDFFLFVKRMKELFEEENARKQKENIAE
ncbi:hypothetical protein NEIRO03_2107 [Nematocida sp. AWRm78]|nr:hypothetical protein NEIRO02_2086 [Nematocida sp. AWRm79]KAI5185756.1 hypothetical protein NEIRO03_2107 [Nematocida sp. AWRm78]